MTVDEEHKKQVEAAYSRFKHLLMEGESAPSENIDGIRVTQLVPPHRPKENDYTEELKEALSSLLDLADVTQGFRDYIKDGFSKIYGTGMAGLGYEQLIEMLGIRIRDNDLGIFDSEKASELETRRYEMACQSHLIGFGYDELLETWGRDIKRKYPTG